MVNGHQGLFERLTYGSQHNVFRIAAIVTSSWSALSVYTMFSGNDANPWIKQFMDVSSTVAFVAIGYFVLRGLAHRIKDKKPVASYVLLSILYAAFEIACNMSVFSGQDTATPWLIGLHTFLLSLSPVVKSTMPIFAASMALIEVDLMVEKGVLPGGALPKSSPLPVVPAGVPRPKQPLGQGQPGGPGPTNQHARPQPRLAAPGPRPQGPAGVTPGQRPPQAAAPRQEPVGQEPPTRTYGSQNPIRAHYNELREQLQQEQELMVP